MFSSVKSITRKIGNFVENSLPGNFTSLRKIKQIPIFLRKYLNKPHIIEPYENDVMHLILKDNCAFCFHWLGIVEKYNALLPIDKRIKISMLTEYEVRNEIFLDPLLYQIPWRATPTLYFKGEMFVGATSSEYCEELLKGLLIKLGYLDLEMYE